MKWFLCRLLAIGASFTPASAFAQSPSGQPPAGWIQIGQGAALPLWKQMSGSCTLSAAGAITCPTVVINPSPLTGSNDTNVTMVLTGTPTTALLQSVAMQLGWTGQLAVARGGTACASASGTCLDNITGFSSTGIVSRTGSGTYSFSAISTLLDVLGSAQGDILYRGVSGWAVLTPGTSGQFLKTQGAAANPIWDNATGTGTVNAGTATQLGYYATTGMAISSNPYLSTYLSSGSNYLQNAVGATNLGAGFISFDGTNEVISGLLNGVGTGCGAGNWAVYNAGCRFTITQSGAARLWAYGPGTAHFDASGNISSQQGCLSILDFGGNPNGTSSPNTNDTPWANLLAAATHSPCVYFPPGKYYFSSQAAYTFPSNNTAAGVAIRGDGPDLTQLYWPGSNGLVLTINGPAQSVHIDNISITTGTAGTYTGLQILNPTCAGSGSFSPAQNSFKNMTFQGFPNTSTWWAGAATLDGVSFTSWDTIGINASTANDGVTLENTNHCGVMIWHNFTSLAVGGTRYSIVINGDNIQGVAVNHSNFQGNLGSIVVLGGANGDEIAADHNSFNPAANGVGIGINASQNGSNIDHNNFYLDNSAASGLTFGVIFNNQPTNFSMIDHNQFFCLGSAGTANGISLAGGSGANNLDGNVFLGCTHAITLNTGSNNNKGSNNIDAGGNGSPFVTNNGTGNSVN